jgi:hypothetical protein
LKKKFNKRNQNEKKIVEARINIYLTKKEILLFKKRDSIQNISHSALVTARR